ncbi:Predicted transcriptional regulator, contains HTH domain [Haladaptatus litoreus]|uniref:Predicted transcriptional regulator, contains HTH domain n=1 Tax=Haladaptatus litoreus TaxID=553468 RepID=A0A1N7EIH7_9EURY|nr:Predicted transcriptional regulator, contains HTH domain [Haladaptatus litoreus]
MINETVDSARLATLRTLDAISNPVTQSEIIRNADITRQAASNHLAVLQNHGFIRSQKARIKLTAGGIALLDVLESCLQILSIKELAFLTRSDHPVAILREFKGEPYRIAELHAAMGGTPSQSTIRRILGDLQNYGWIEESNREKQITALGRQVLEAYNELSLSVQQLIEKAPWLQRLPLEDATFPIQELSDAKLVVSDPARPASVLSAALTLYDWDTSQFRGLCSIYNPVLFHTYRAAYRLFDYSIDSEMIFDWPTFAKITKATETRYILDSLDFSDYEVYALDYPHTLGIGIYDNRRVAVGAYNESGDGNHIAMIVSSNDKLVEWGIDLYESYRADATPATETDIGRL